MRLLQWHDIYPYIPPFVKIDAGIQTILRFYFSSLNGCNIGITDGRNL
jgi:hypothetical protein